MCPVDIKWANRVLGQIVGRQLSSVTFVQDYVQMSFDGPAVTAVTHPVVEAEGVAYRWDETGFRDQLCKRIAHIVTKAEIIPDECVRIDFDDRAKISVSLLSQDYVAAEAVRFDASPQIWWVL